VENSTNLYDLWTLAKTWKTRPSEILCIRDEVAAYHLDRAVTKFGLALEQDVEKHTESAKDRKSAEAKARLVLKRWLREPEELSTVAQAQAQARADGKSGYRDPMERFKKE
jgi:hypothetical protein